MRRRLPTIVSILCLGLALSGCPGPDDDGSDGGGSTDGGGGGTDGGGGGSDAGSGCGTLTFAGECVGSWLRYCLDDTVQEYNCAEDGVSSCGLIETEYGYDCVLPAGEACLFDDGAGGTEQWFCAGTGAGCVDDSFDVTCRESLGACVDADINTCVGDLLVLECLINQPFAVDCSGYGGSCNLGRCENVADGKPCDDLRLICAAGSNCTAGSCRGGGTDGGTPTDGGLSDDGGSGPLDGGPATDGGSGPMDGGSADDGGSGPLDGGPATDGG